MSTLVYGNLLAKRIATPAGRDLGLGTAGEAEKTEPVKQWLDALSALVPAEVLAIHGVAMSFGTTTTGSGEDTVTKITYPTQMMVVYCAMVLLTFVFVFAGAKTARKATVWLGGLIAALAFIAWTMIQPSTAFDAFPFTLTTFARVMIAVFLAVILGVASTALARRAKNEEATQ